MWVVWLPYWTVRTNGPHCGRRTKDYTSSGCINTAVLIQPGFPDSSVGKYSTCNARDPGSIPGSGRSPGEGIGYLLQYSWASLVAQLVKKPSCNVGDLGLIPGLGRSPGEGKGYPLQCSGLENSMDCIVLGSQRVGQFHFSVQFQNVHTKLSPHQSEMG